MSSYPVYPTGLYGPMTSATSCIPQVPSGVSMAPLGLRPPQHHVGIPMAHQSLLPPGHNDGSQMVNPPLLQHTGHPMPQTTQGISGHPAWCYLPPPNPAQALPMEHTLEKDTKLDFCFQAKMQQNVYTSSDPHLRLQKEVMDYAANGVVPGGSGMASGNLPPMPMENLPGTSNGNISQAPTVQQPVESKPAVESKPPVKKRKVKPKRPCMSKKRNKNPDMWKKNVSKCKKIRGEEHVSRNGTLIPAKEVETVDCSLCTFRCNDNFNETLRHTLFKMFYSLGSNETQKQFVCQNVTEESTKQSKTAEDGSSVENRRKVTRKYYLPDGDNSRSQVCSRFFRGTLAVGKSFITHALKHKMFGCYMGQEKRGFPHNKTPTALVESAKSHIEALLFSDSKSLKKKKSPKKKCLEKGLTVAKMYDIYKEDCEKKDEKPVSLCIYRRVFHTEF